MYNLHLLDPIKELKNKGHNFSNIVITIDFDGTLSRKIIQEWAKELVSLGFDVWVVTTRRSIYNQRSILTNSNLTLNSDFLTYMVNDCNDEVYSISSEVGIKPSKVLFTEHEWKASFLKTLNSLVHLDDNPQEFREISKDRCKTIGLQVFNVTTWQTKLVKILTSQFM